LISRFEGFQDLKVGKFLVFRGEESFGVGMIRALSFRSERCGVRHRGLGDWDVGFKGQDLDA